MELESLRSKAEKSDREGWVGVLQLLHLIVFIAKTRDTNNFDFLTLFWVIANYRSSSFRHRLNEYREK